MHRRALLALASSSLAVMILGHTAARADEYRVSGPVVHENLAIYLVHGKSAAGAVPLTLDEALRKGAVKVHETGTVSELQIENLGTDEVFIQAGDIVKGGQQDRVLSVSLVLPPKSGRLPIASFCVEQGRWSARGKEDVKTFATASASVPSREAKIAIRAPAATAPTDSGRVIGHFLSGQAYDRAAARSVAPASPQQQVWAKVRKVQDGLSSNLGAPVQAAASQSSLQLSLENEKLASARSAYVKALKSEGEKDNDDYSERTSKVNGRLMHEKLSKRGGDNEAVIESQSVVACDWKRGLVNIDRQRQGCTEQRPEYAERVLDFIPGPLLLPARHVHEFVQHYHHERNHQGMRNQLLFPIERTGASDGPMACRARLGGLLKYYDRPAA